MPSLRPQEGHVAMGSPRPAARALRAPKIEWAADLGRFAIVALYLLAVLVTARWPARARRAIAATRDGNWQPGGA